MCPTFSIVPTPTTFTDINHITVADFMRTLSDNNTSTVCITEQINTHSVMHVFTLFPLTPKLTDLVMILNIAPMGGQTGLTQLDSEQVNACLELITITTPSDWCPIMVGDLSLTTPTNLVIFYIHRANLKDFNWNLAGSDSKAFIKCPLLLSANLSSSLIPMVKSVLTKLPLMFFEDSKI